jgi:hypothetical protein
MYESISLGRLVGVMLLVHLVGQFFGFYLLTPGVGADYLSVAPAMGPTIRIAVIVLLANSILTLAIAGIVFPVLRMYGPQTATLLVVIGAVWMVMQFIDNAYILSMLSMSNHFIEIPNSNTDFYQALATQVRTTRGFVHSTQLLVIDTWLGILYTALFAFRLVPATVGGIGMSGVALHLIGLPLAVFLGYQSVPVLAFGLPISYLVVGGWLVVKGFPKTILSKAGSGVMICPAYQDDRDKC